MELLDLLPYVLMLPLGWLFVLYRGLSKRVDDMQKTYYDKAETKEMIELHIRPIVQGLERVQQDTTEIKAMIGKLFDGQNKN